jgi:two-component system sensor histidine kinase TctE
LKTGSRPPLSLRQLLLTWLLPGVVLLLVASGSSAYLVAWHNATQAYDRSLLNLAIALSNQVRSEKGRFRLDLQPQALQILLTDKFDRIHYAVFGPHGELLGGESALFPQEAPAAEDFIDNHFAFDTTLDGREIRGVILLAKQEGREVTVLVGETLVKRETQVGEILLSIIVPEFLLAAATIAVMMFGVGVGLRPLEALRAQLRRRSPQDMSPIGVEHLPQELQPLATEIDHLLQRLGVALDAQRHFVSDASHQLRTPIAALQAQLESTMREGGDARLTPILVAANRLAHLVHQLLALARAEPGGSTAHEEIDLKGLVREEADYWMSLAVARDIDLGFDLDYRPGSAAEPVSGSVIEPAAEDVVEAALVSGSRLLLGELLTNLVDNAIRYTPAGGRVTVSVGASVGLPPSVRGAADDAVVLVVEDSGPGIPAALREQVFERFFRVGQGTADGCGLGLAVVRQIAEQHAASIFIDDAVGGGARISLRFPRHHPSS